MQGELLEYCKKNYPSLDFEQPIDLQMSSLDWVEFIIRLEEKFSIQINQFELEENRPMSIQKLVKILDKSKLKKSK